jgi:hypothetical protein
MKNKIKIKIISRTNIFLVGLIMILLCLNNTLGAEEDFNVWTGNISNSWYEPGNWLLEKVPSETDERPVIIPVTTTGNNPVISYKENDQGEQEWASVYHYIDIQSGAKLTLNPDSALKINIIGQYSGIAIRENATLIVEAGSKIRTYSTTSKPLGIIDVHGKFIANGSQDAPIQFQSGGGRIAQIRIASKGYLDFNWVNSVHRNKLFRFLGFGEGGPPEHFNVKNSKMSAWNYMDYPFMVWGENGFDIKFENSTISGLTNPIHLGSGNLRTTFFQTFDNANSSQVVYSDQLLEGWGVNICKNNDYVYYPGWREMDWNASSPKAGANNNVIIRGAVSEPEVPRIVRLTADENCNKLTIEQGGGLHLNSHTLNCDNVENQGIIYLGEPEGEIIYSSGSLGKVITGSPLPRTLSAENDGVRDSKQWAIEPPPESSYLKWGKPYVKDKLTVLFLVDSIRGGNRREIFELAQRFDIDTRVITFANKQPDFWEIETIREELKHNPAVIVSYGMGYWTDYPEDIRDMIAEAISRGVGYVTLYPNDKKDALSDLVPVVSAGIGKSDNPWQASKSHYLTNSLPLEALPQPWHYTYTSKQFSEELITDGNYSILTVYEEEGNVGRVASLAYAGSDYNPQTHRSGGGMAIIPYPMSDGRFGYSRYNYEQEWPYWEVYYSLLAKTIFWTGKHLPPIQIQSIFAPNSQMSDTNNIQIMLKRDGEEAGSFIGKLEIQLRDNYFNLEEKYLLDVSLESDEQSIMKELEINTSKLTSGSHFIVISLLDTEGKHYDWGMATFNIEQSISIESLEPNREFYYRDDEIIDITLNSVLKNKDISNKSLTALVTLTDSWDRLVYQASQNITIETGDTTIPFAINIPKYKLLTGYYKAKVVLSDKAGPVATKRVSVWIPMDPKSLRDEWQTGGWMFPVHPHLNDIFMDAQRSYMGWTWYSNGGGNEDYEGTPNNMWVARENVWHLGSWNEVYPEGKRTLNLCDSNVLESAKNKIIRFVQQRNSANILGYASGEEMALAVNEVDFSEQCINSYHEWLKQNYKTISALNNEWETDYESFDDITPSKSSELNSLPNPAPFIDFRIFMEKIWMDAISSFGDWVNIANSNALAGWNAGPHQDTPFGGWNFGEIGRKGTWTLEYFGEKNEFLRSTMVEPFKIVTGYWYDRASYRHVPWWVAFHGGNGVAYFRTLGRVKGHLHPSFAPNEWSEYVKEDNTDLQKGIGKIILTSNRENDGIAIFYSRPSRMLNWVETFLEYGGGHMGSASFISTANRQYDYIVNSQIPEGKLQNYTILLLPSSTAMSNEELEKIEDFVDTGGVVIADVRTGLYDEHGKLAVRRTKADELFGVNRSGKDTYNKIPTTAGNLIVPIGALGNDKRIEVFSEGRENISTLGESVALANYADGVPAVIKKNYGKGMTFYINGVVIGDDGNVLMDTLLKYVNNTPLVSTNKDWEFVRFTNGKMKYIGVLRSTRSDVEETQTLSLTEKTHTYDVRAGKYLGEIDTMEISLPAGGAAFFATLPYKVKGISIDVPPSIDPGQDLNYSIELDVSENLPGDHVIRLEFFDPTGQLSHAYTKNVLATRGIYTDRLPLAINEQLGKWKLIATDVASGLNTTVEINIILLGDVNEDGKINVDDLVTLTKSIGSNKNDPEWNDLADVAEPWGVIDARDLITVARQITPTREA